MPWWFPIGAISRTTTDDEKRQYIPSLSTCLATPMQTLKDLINSLHINNRYQNIQVKLKKIGLNIPPLNKYDGKESGVSNWICFGTPPKHCPKDQIKGIVLCPAWAFRFLEKAVTQRNICIPEVLCLSPTSPAPMPTPRPSKIADCQIVSPPPKKKENEINENIHSNTAIILSVKAHTEKLDATKLLDGDSETKVHDEKAYNSITGSQIVSPPAKTITNEINERICINNANILRLKANTEKLHGTKLPEGNSETTVHDEKADNSIVSTSQLPSQCTGLDSNRIKLLFKKNPSLCLSKWSYHLGWRSTTCDKLTPTNSFTESKRKRCGRCYAVVKNLSRIEKGFQSASTKDNSMARICKIAIREIKHVHSNSSSEKGRILLTLANVLKAAGSSELIRIGVHHKFTTCNVADGEPKNCLGYTIHALNATVQLCTNCSITQNNYNRRTIRSVTNKDNVVRASSKTAFSRLNPDQKVQRLCVITFRA